MKSWAYYVTTAGDNGSYATNSLRFATKAEAEKYGWNLEMRWLAVVAGEARETSDPVTSRWDAETGLHEVEMAHTVPDDNPFVRVTDRDWGE